MICDLFSVIINIVKGKVQVGLKNWKMKVVLNVLKRVDLFKMVMEIVINLKVYFFVCYKEFIGEIKKVQGLFDCREIIKDE